MTLFDGDVSGSLLLVLGVVVVVAVVVVVVLAAVVVVDTVRVVVWSSGGAVVVCSTVSLTSLRTLMPCALAAVPRWTSNAGTSSEMVL